MAKQSFKLNFKTISLDFSNSKMLNPIQAISDDEIEPNQHQKNAIKGMKKSKHSMRNERKRQQLIEEERNLEKIVFGDETEVLENLEKETNELEPKDDEKPKRKPVWEDEDDNNIK